MKLLNRLFLVMFIVSCTGCATVGRDFNYTNVPKLEIGSLKSADYHNVIGTPWNTQTISNADGRFEDIRFLYGYGNLATATARALDLEFRDGSLNAWFYVSSFDDDRTAVRLALISKIEKTVSTKSDVQKVLGKPHGKALCPSLLSDYKDRCKDTAEVWAWGATNTVVTLAKEPIETSSIFVRFDKNATVTEVETVQRKNERQLR